MTRQPVRSVCWPDDPDYLDGKTEIELPSRRYTQVFWDADIIDLDDKNKADADPRHGTGLPGALPRRNAGKALAVSSPATGCSTSASSRSGRDPASTCRRFSPATRDSRSRTGGAATGCASSSISDVPPDTIKLRDGQDTEVYEVAAKVELRCCDGHVAVAGYEALEEYEFFRGA